MRRRNEAGTGRSNTCSGIMEMIYIYTYIAKKSLGTKYLVRLQSDFSLGQNPFFQILPQKRRNSFDGSLEPPYPRSTPQWSLHQPPENCPRICRGRRHDKGSGTLAHESAHCHNNTA